MGTKAQTALLTKIEQDLQVLRSDADCNLEKFGQWLCENINPLSKTLTGHGGRKLKSCEPRICYVLQTEEGLQLNTTMRWSYRGRSGEPPALEAIGQYLTDFSLVKHEDYYQDSYLWAVVDFNLNRWPALAPVALAHFLRNSIAASPMSSDARFGDENVRDLLNAFYPHVTLDYLKLAVDLGMLDKGDAEFVEWFNRAANATDADALPALDVIMQNEVLL